MDKYVHGFNDRRIRRQPEKDGPSGASHNHAYRHPELFGGTDQMNRVHPRLIDQLLVDHPGAEAVRFYPAWFDEVARHAHYLADFPELSLAAAWDTFRLMIDDVVRLVSEI